jgi:hypothetical protein
MLDPTIHQELDQARAAIAAGQEPDPDRLRELILRAREWARERRRDQRSGSQTTSDEVRADLDEVAHPAELTSVAPDPCPCPDVANDAMLDTAAPPVRRRRRARGDDAFLARLQAVGGHY